jgi:hypothetical protein
MIPWTSELMPLTTLLVLEAALEISDRFCCVFNPETGLLAEFSLIEGGGDI